MSMFHSPNDDSSSDTSSEASLNEEIVLSSNEKDQEMAPGLQSSETLPLAQQQSLMIASLLRSHYQHRAAELLNSAHHGAIKHDQDSSEVTAYAQQMFDQASQLFVSKGLIDKTVLQPNFAPAMQSYLTGIDQLGVKALQDGSAGRRTPRLVIESGKAFSSSVDQSLFQLDNMAIALPTFGLPLTNRRQPPQVSRYSSEFTEEKVIGRGGFGTVYHCINQIDAGHYAIKRISLDVRRLARNGEAAMQRELHKILQEIRTMAKLEHNNIVRYYGAWIEHANAIANEAVGENSAERSLILCRTGTVQTESTDSEAEASDGIIFGEDSRSQPAPHAECTMEDLITSSTSTDSSSNETDPFTDGDGATTRGGSRAPSAGMILNIQMSLHEHNLATYLSDRAGARGHCFHLRPALCIFLGILTGVQYLHASGFVHRDLKPANVFMSESGGPRHGFEVVGCGVCEIGGKGRGERRVNVRVGDFGLAAEDIVANGEGGVVEVMRTGGTELYRPPPVAAARAGGDVNEEEGEGEDAVGIVDEKLDVFALGILLFELLWRFETRAERVVVLEGLRREGRLPVGFKERIDRVNGNEFGVGVGAMVEKCLRGMVVGDGETGRRWGLGVVRRAVVGVMGMC